MANFPWLSQPSNPKDKPPQHLPRSTRTNVQNILEEVGDRYVVPTLAAGALLGGIAGATLMAQYIPSVTSEQQAGLAKGVGIGLGATAVIGALGFLGFKGLQRRLGAVTGQSAVSAGRATATAAASVGLAAGKVAMNTASGIERIARFALTGDATGGFGLRAARQAWFPYLRHLQPGDLRRYAPNPRIGKAIVGYGLVGAAVSGVGETLRNPAPPPTLFFDGRSMNHKADYGANADYAQRLMGSASNLNEDPEFWIKRGIQVL